MKKIIIMFIAGAFALTSFESCKKDDDSSGSASIVGDWIQTGATQDGKSTWDTPFWEDCEKDDITTFKSDGTYSVDEGPTKCDPNDPQINDSGSYSISSDNKKLTMGIFVFDIIKLTSTELSASLDFGGSIATSTFKRK